MPNLKAAPATGYPALRPIPNPSALSYFAADRLRAQSRMIVIVKRVFFMVFLFEDFFL
jgi:hypothetical protein